MSHQVVGDVLGEDWKGYVFKITGGNDLDGFAMKQGVLTNGRVRLLLKAGDKNFTCKKKGMRKRKSVRGCIVSTGLSVLNLVVIKKGDADIAGLTDISKPAAKFPKRANKIRKLFNLTKEDDVTKFVVKKTVEKTSKAGVAKKLVKAPKVQRLVTPARVHMKRRQEAAIKKAYTKTRQDAEEFNALVALRRKQFAAAKQAALSKKRSLSRKLSEKATAAQ